MSADPPAPARGPLAMIAGGGDYPLQLARSLTQGGERPYIVALDGAADPAAFDAVWLLPDDEEMRPVHHLGANSYALLGQGFTIALPEDKASEKS